MKKWYLILTVISTKAKKVHTVHVENVIVSMYVCAYFELIIKVFVCIFFSHFPLSIRNDTKTTPQKPHASGNAPSNIVKQSKGKKIFLVENTNIFIWKTCWYFILFHLDSVHHPAPSVSLVVSVPLPGSNLPANTTTAPSHHPNIQSFANSKPSSSVSF